nr:MAG TPA: UBA-like domain protein [Caudoviricetes sp.]
MKTIELLNKVVELGFDREKALADIDASLDNVIGVENRKPLTEEEINEKLALNILFGFNCDKE